MAAESLLIHPGGQCYGTVKTESAEIRGTLQGDVVVKHLISIRETGSVSGNVQYGALAMEPGGNLSAEVRNVPPAVAGDLDLTVDKGRSVPITLEDLHAIDPDDDAKDLVFSVSNARNGFVRSHRRARTAGRKVHPGRSRRRPGQLRARRHRHARCELRRRGGRPHRRHLRPATNREGDGARGLTLHVGSGAATRTTPFSRAAERSGPSPRLRNPCPGGKMRAAPIRQQRQEDAPCLSPRSDTPACDRTSWTTGPSTGRSSWGCSWWSGRAARSSSAWTTASSASSSLGGDRAERVRLGGRGRSGAGCAGRPAGGGQGAPSSGCRRRVAALRGVRDGDLLRGPGRHPAGGIPRRRDVDAPFVPGRPISGFRTGTLGMGHVVLHVKKRRRSALVLPGRARLRPQRLHPEALQGVLLPRQSAPPQPRHDRDRPQRHPSHHDGAASISTTSARPTTSRSSEPGRIGTTLGRHTNDFMTSFYARTPNDFMVEYGWGGRSIDPDDLAAGGDDLRARACGATTAPGCRPTSWPSRAPCAPRPPPTDCASRCR